MHRTSLFLTKELHAGLKALKQEHGTPEAESIRRAITAYLKEKRVPKTTKPKRKTRRRT